MIIKEKNHIPFSYDPRTMICVLKYHNNIIAIFLLLCSVYGQTGFQLFIQSNCDDGSAI